MSELGSKLPLKMVKLINEVFKRIDRKRERADVINTLDEFVRRDASKPDIKKIKDSIPTIKQIDDMGKRIKHESGE